MKAERQSRKCFKDDTCESALGRYGARRRWNALQPTLIALALGSALPSIAAAQYCQYNGSSSYNCNASGSFGSSVAMSQGAVSGGSNSLYMPISVTGSIGFTYPSSTNAAIQFSAYGADYNSAPGGNSGGISLTNSAPISIAGGQSPVSDYVFGLWGQQMAGYGNGGGSTTQMNTVANNANITIALSGVQTYGGAGIWLTDQGGAANANSSAGSSAGASITNTGTINATLSGQDGFAGMQAFSYGGNANGSGQGNGGNSGTAAVSSSAPVTVNYNWQGAGSSNNGLWGVQALSDGGAGSNNDNGNGGSAGTSGFAGVQLTAGANVALSVSGSPPSGNPFVPSAAVIAATVGGTGGYGKNQNNASAGNGGDVTGGNYPIGNSGAPVYSAAISITDASVAVNGLPGVVALALGGPGGAGGVSENENNTDPRENGGSGGNINATAAISIATQTQALSISTTGGNNAAAVAAQMQGGNGGVAGYSHDTGASTSQGGTGGNGGSVQAPLYVTLAGSAQNTITLSTTGSQSPGIFASSNGGAGADGGGADTALAGKAEGGNGGTGGNANDVTVSAAYTAINTQGSNSPGLIAQSVGGLGGSGGGANATKADGGSGSNGGNSGNVTVTVTGGSISTQTADSVGILAQSVSGSGGGGGNENGHLYTGTDHSGMGGTAGTVTVTNSASITTVGDNARGILAQSLAGSGGLGGDSWGLFHSSGGQGNSGGPGNSVAVTHSGNITTQGANAEGILVQSIGGDGGAGGSGSGVISNVGGGGGSGSNGGAVNFTFNGGTIGTSGNSAIGVLGQSIGGGGGDGGGASGTFVSIGGDGADGANGSSVTAVLNAGSTINTSGDYATGMIMQSIGGGGGNGGNASAAAPFAAVSIGGTGDGGGTGGTVNVSLNNANISTSGSKASGLIAQSIGGGGGTGGNAASYSLGAGVAATVGLGGSGGSGNAGGYAGVTMTGGSIMTGQDPRLTTVMPFTAGGCSASSPGAVPCNALPVDSYGAVVQSIGGGGGLGGSAVAESIAVSTPVSEGGDQAAIAMSVTVGGSGGTGGNGGTAEFSLSNGATIQTRGNGSTGVLVQSIGGGGGAGGDSSSTAAVIGYPNTLPTGKSGPGGTIEFTMGGSGKEGGDGGNVNVAIGGTVSNGVFTQDSNASPTSITTYGDFAAGIKAQSVGGGGGDAGVGSGNTQQFGTGSSTSFAINAGSTGGAGGNGGTVNVNVYSGNGISTYGSGAMGVIAQSVGGGGGISQGGSYGVSQSFETPSKAEDSKPSTKFKLGATVNLGSQGSSGGNAQAVTVNVGAPISTLGSDATGVMVQSVGGGGGIGGGATGDGSGDTPIVQALNGREFQSDVNAALEKGQIPEIDPTFTLSFGGTGGTGGSGSTATANVSAPISTSGDWANGIVAQSIGGGGGKGGTGAASGTGSIAEIGINLDYALGGQGGSGGDGGSASVSLASGAGVSTQGFGASAIVVQSVGGGGGMGADGSDSASGTISVGLAGPGKGGVGGSGGAATFSFNGGNPVISTAGDMADGIVVQSVGGGGGIAGAGSSVFGQLAPALANAQGTLKLTAGGGSAANGSGGAVNFNQNNTPLTIQTSGDYAFGILAQSVGGGGGVISAAQTVASPTLKIGGQGGGAGGNVTVTNTSSTSIATHGTGAIGILAQSVGNGGGIIRMVGGNASGVPTLTSGPNSNFSQSKAGDGNGGNVVVNHWGSINATGNGAIGIFAQSVGGGGGLIIDGSTLYAGTPMQNSCGNCGAGGSVNVNVNGAVSASGTNGIGIFAQSIGYTMQQGGNPDLQILAPVAGGTASGAAGIVVDNTNNAAYVNVYTNGTLGTQDGTNGVAVRETNSGKIALANYGGNITGSLYLNYGQFTNNSGNYYAGPVIQADVTNWDSFIMSDPGMTTQMTGTFIQKNSGRLTATIDSLNKRASLLRVNGYASVDGTIVPSAITLLPGELPVLTADSLDMTANAQDSLLYDWDARRSGNTISLNPNADFRPAGVSLSDSQSSMANYYGRGWNNSDPTLAPLFAALSRINDGGTYKSSLNSLSGKATQAQSIALANQAGSILGSSMSCPVFVGDTVRLGEDSCVWGQFSGRWSDQSGTGDTVGYHVSGTTYRIGGQRQISPGWYLGGSVAAGQTWARMDGGSNGDGDTYDGSLTLKRVNGPWYFAGSLAAASGSFNTNRHVELPGVNETLTSSPDMFMAGARFRAGYQFDFDRWYIKPYNDIDIVHTHLPGFKESGPSPYALDVRGSDQTNVMLSPMLEFGMRREVDPKTTLRAYAAFGASWRPDSDRTIRSSIVGASSDDGTFTDYVKSPELMGKVDLGLQFYRANGFEIKASYTADIGRSFVSQTASARFAYHF